MNILFLSPHFPENFQNFALALAEQGAAIFGVTDVYDQALSPALRQALKGHYRVGSLHNDEEVFRAVEFFLANLGPIHRVESHLESWLMLEAKIREKYAITGFKPDKMLDFKKKSRMKGIFQAAGIPTARGEVVRVASEIENFLRGVGFPIFLKPNEGIGASDSHKLSSAVDLRHFLNSHPEPFEFFLEEFISGEVESFDGYADSRGVPVFHTGHRNNGDIREIVSEHRDFTFTSFRRVPIDLEELGRRVLAAFGIREKFFHLEFFRTPANELRAIEVNLRPPGGRTTDMFNYAADIDVYQEWAKEVTGTPWTGGAVKKYHVCHVSRREEKVYRRDHAELQGLLGDSLVAHTRFDDCTAIGMGRFAYLIRHPRIEKIREMARWIQETVS